MSVTTHMSNILVMIDGELSHVYPTLRLAKDLRARGHKVTYAGFPSVRPMVSDHGFDFQDAFRHLVPPGVTSANDALLSSALFQCLLTGQVFDEMWGKVKPDLFVTLTVFCLAALIVKYRYGTPAVLVRTHCTLLSRRKELEKILAGELMHLGGNLLLLWQLLADCGRSTNSIAALADTAMEMPEIAFQAKEFASVDAESEERLFFAGSWPEDKIGTSGPCWRRAKFGGKRLLCSLGTRPDLEAKVSHRFIQTLINAVARRPQIELIITTGNRMEPEAFRGASRSTRIVRWVEQRVLLSQADLMLTHGGFGSIKECILAGVPMLVFPMLRDQFAAADSVAGLGLGFKGDIERSTETQLLQLIDKALASPAVRERVRLMRDCFLRTDPAVAVEVIEQELRPRMSPIQVA